MDFKCYKLKSRWNAANRLYSSLIYSKAALHASQIAFNLVLVDFNFACSLVKIMEYGIKVTAEVYKSTNCIIRQLLVNRRNHVLLVVWSIYTFGT